MHPHVRIQQTEVGKFLPLKVEGNVIRDGHHRYIAARLANYKFETVPYRAPNPPDNWSSIQLELVDWDICQENNDKLDAKDAQYNSMTIEELRKRLK